MTNEEKKALADNLSKDILELLKKYGFSEMAYVCVTTREDGRTDTLIGQGFQPGADRKLDALVEGIGAMMRASQNQARSDRN